MRQLGSLVRGYTISIVVFDHGTEIAKLVPLYDDSVAYSRAFKLYDTKIIHNNLNAGISIITMLMYPCPIAARLITAC